MERCAGTIIPLHFVLWGWGLLPYVVACMIFGFLVTFYFLIKYKSKGQSYAGVDRCRDTLRYTCNQSFATEFISVLLQDLPPNRTRKLEELKWVVIPCCWITNKLFLVSWGGISVRQDL